MSAHEFMFPCKGNEVDIKNWDSLCCRRCCANLEQGKLQCNCGEQVQLYKWLWENPKLDNVIVTPDRREVQFHPVYSSGTAAVRGDYILQKNQMYYYEVKVLTFLYGTDVMVGVATTDFNFTEYNAKFCSLLGTNKQSWGYSYKGYIHHDGMSRNYGRPYGIGSLVGVLIDMFQGTIEFYLNRKSQGLAFTGLKSMKLYPVVCSTAAQSSIRLTHSSEFEPSLQFQCLKKIQKRRDAVDIWNLVPGLTKMFPYDFYWLLPSTDEEPVELTSDDLSLEDLAVIPISKLIPKEYYITIAQFDKWGRNYHKVNPELYEAALIQNYMPGDKVKRRCKCATSVTRRLLEEKRRQALLCSTIESIRGDLDKRKREVVADQASGCDQESYKKCTTCRLAKESCRCSETFQEDYASGGSPSVKKDVFLTETDTVDVYEDLPDFEGGGGGRERYCERCNFRLGTHAICRNDRFCSLCSFDI